MPPVLIAVAVAAVPAALGVAFGAVTVGAAVIGVAATALSAGVSYALRDGSTPAIGAAPSAGPQASSPNAFRQLTVRQAVPPRRIVYGNCRVGGFVFFQQTDNPDLYIGIGLSDGPIEAIDAVLFGDTEIALDVSGDAATGDPYVGNFHLEKSLGVSGQAASVLLLAAFSTLDATFKQDSVARAVIRMDWGADATEHNTLWGASITPVFEIRGVLCYDPRTATTAYTTNPALCVADALMRCWETAVAFADIDWDSVETAADICDEQIEYNSELRAIFELSGVFQSDVNLASQIEDMLRSFGGTLTLSGGKLQIIADSARSSVFTITDDDIIEFGGFRHAGPLADTFNSIKATYYDGDEGGVKIATPTYDMTTEIAAEGRRETSLDLKFTSAPHSAQILAYRFLQRSRDQRLLTLRLPDFALYFQPCDRVTVDSDVADYCNGEYEVLQVDLADGGVYVVLGGYNADTYTDPTTYLVVA